MAFKKAKFGSKNPTGDKTFNKITKHVFTDNSKPPPKPDADGDFDGDEDDQRPSYDTATNTFRGNRKGK